MSTRAVYTFKDDHEKFSVYKHHDGYPESAAEFLRQAIGKSWAYNENNSFPIDARFEASDMAAAFIAANKTGGGGVYVTKSAASHGDLSYSYTMYSRAGVLCVDAFKHGEQKKKIFSGPLKVFAEQFAAN